MDKKLIELPERPEEKINTKKVIWFCMLDLMFLVSKEKTRMGANDR